MKYNALGTTGVKVSELCFGTMSFGGDANEEESGRMYKACRKAGVNFFDCADVYNAGKSEEILGRLIAGERDDLVITSKCHGPMGDDVNARGSNRRHIVRAVEASLRRLDTDRIDILFMHRFDNDLPLEETLRALENVVQSGKVLYIGASNYAAWQVARALGISERRGWSRIDVIQPMYSLLKRQVESEILPMAAAENVGVITYSPVGGGALSGKYGPDMHPSDGRLVANKEYAKRYSVEGTYETAAAFTAFAKEMGVHPVSLAVAWVGSHPAVTSPIVGARNVEQLKPALDSVNIDMTSDLRAEISALSKAPPPATDRFEESG
ncbi:MAG TPA: aldo/keto reductase [Burkholderiales bacterium]|nr:aldo/keto reductase [Burkholderiales bacterium]